MASPELVIYVHTKLQTLTINTFHHLYAPTQTLYPSHSVLQSPPLLIAEFHLSKFALEMPYSLVMVSQLSLSATLCHFLQPQIGEGCGFAGALGLQLLGSSASTGLASAY
jgi:hypothetical protein